MLEQIKLLKLNRSILKNLSNDFKMPKQLGYVPINASWELINKLTQLCQHHYDSLRNSDLLPNGEIIEPQDYQKDLFRIRTPDSTHAIEAFCTDPRILSMIMDYLGELPIVQDIGLYWSSTNSSRDSSQQFHLDKAYDKQVKFSINIWPTNIENGPLSFLPADISKNFCEVSGQKWATKLSDDEIYNICPKSALVEVLGEPGSGMAVDTSRCFHFGGRAFNGERLIFRANFSPRIYANKLKRRLPFQKQTTSNLLYKQIFVL